MSFGIS
ncbi:hypothetical protein AYI68_g7014, partial [Smittium mucronatum]